MAQRKITAKQQEILDYIKEEILKKGYLLFFFISAIIKP